MIDTSKKICIVGSGGFGKEVLCLIIDTVKGLAVNIKDLVVFMEPDEIQKQTKQVLGIDVIAQSSFDSQKYNVVIAVGNPAKRKKIVEDLPVDTSYITLIHPSVTISQWVKIGKGSIICAGTILTCDINIGDHAHLNLLTTVGHDCEIGNYFSTAPGVNISGKCVFGECVYFGTNSCVREGVQICNDVVIGMGGVVVKSINEPGVYIGNPLTKLVKE